MERRMLFKWVFCCVVQCDVCLDFWTLCIYVGCKPMRGLPTGLFRRVWVAGRGRRMGDWKAPGRWWHVVISMGAVLLICSGSVRCVLFSWGDKRKKKVAAEQEKKQRAFHA